MCGFKDKCTEKIIIKPHWNSLAYRHLWKGAEKPTFYYRVTNIFYFFPFHLSSRFYWQNALIRFILHQIFTSQTLQCMSCKLFPFLSFYLSIIILLILRNTKVGKCCFSLCSVCLKCWVTFSFLFHFKNWKYVYLKESNKFCKQTLHRENDIFQVEALTNLNFVL